MIKTRKAIFSDFGMVWRSDICGKQHSVSRHARCSRERQRRMAQSNADPEVRPAG